MSVIKCAFQYFHYFIILFILDAVIGHHHHQSNHHTHGKVQDSLISTKELRKVSEELFDKTPNGIYQSIFISYQGKRDSKDVKDEASEHLFNVPSYLFENAPTIQQMRKLYDNYDINSHHAENVTPEENSEENDFIDSLLNTNVMMHLMDFLASKGYFSKNLTEYKQILKKIWFDPYSRSNHTEELGSSGFEHVFLVEKNHRNHITGLHNWVFFATEEYSNKINYLGYISKEQLADKAAVIKFYLSYLGKTKLSSMLIGTPPEFEIALYTLCFYARPNKNCNLLLGNTKLTIQTWVQNTNNGKLVSSAFPKIYN